MLKIAFVEPPKDFWFIMGEYISPPFGVLALAAYVEEHNPGVEINVIDCQAEMLDWAGLERRLENLQADVVASSSLSTSNAYAVIRTADIAKSVNPETLNMVGGQHFTALAAETLQDYPVVDMVVRGEGEVTLSEILKSVGAGRSMKDIPGVSYRVKGGITHNCERSLIEDLNSLPYPAYHFVEDHMTKYYFSLMADSQDPFAIVEGSRGCTHNCSYCSQWGFWRRNHRAKSPARIADEIEHVHRTYGSKFFWLTDDNLGLGAHTEGLCEEILKRDLDGVTWFTQLRCDDIVKRMDIIPKLREAGNVWVLLGFDSPHPGTLKKFRRDGVDKPTSKKAVEILRLNDIFSQGTFIIGERRDSEQSIEELMEYADWLDPDIATFMALTPFPGTDVYAEAKENGWIEDTNWSHYDMIHAIMPTEHLTRNEVQESLYRCYQKYFGSWPRRYRGILSENSITRRTYHYLAKKAILTGLRSLF